MYLNHLCLNLHGKKLQGNFFDASIRRSLVTGVSIQNWSFRFDRKNS